MFKRGIALVLTVALLLPVSSFAGQGNGAKRLVEYRSDLLPPASYKGQWWTSPQKCQYSRAGRPGETVWYLIVNTAHTKCPSRLIQRAYSDYN